MLGKTLTCLQLVVLHDLLQVTDSLVVGTDAKATQGKLTFKHQSLDIEQNQT